MFDINGGEFLVLIVVALVVLGPERLPQYAQQLARLVRELRRMAQGARESVRNEMGPEFDDIDWQKLDPRQYDPRRIVRDALADVWNPEASPGDGRVNDQSEPASGPAAPRGPVRERAAGEPPPFDADAT